MSFTLTTSAAIAVKAGASVSTSILNSGALMVKVADLAESTLCGLTRYDWIANYSSVGTNFKPMLDDGVANLAAMELIKYDQSGYTNIPEAQTMLDVLKDNFERIVKFLSDDQNRGVLLGKTNVS